MSNSFRTSTCGSLTSRATATANGLSVPAPSSAVSPCLAAYTTMKSADGSISEKPLSTSFSAIVCCVVAAKGLSRQASSMTRRSLRAPPTAAITCSSAPAQVHRAAVVVSDGEIRALLQSEIVVGDRLVVLALALVGPAARVEETDIVGIELERLVVGFDRLVDVALGEEHAAANGVGQRQILSGCLAVQDQSLAGIRACPQVASPLAAGRNVVPQFRTGQCGKAERTEHHERKQKGAPHVQLAPAQRKFVGETCRGSFQDGLPPRRRTRLNALVIGDLFTDSCPLAGNKSTPAPYLGGKKGAAGNCEAPRARLRLPSTADTQAQTRNSMSQFSRLSLCAAAIGALAIAAFVSVPTRAAEDAVVIPAPASDVAPADGLQTAVLSGGCFWGVQGVFQHTAGVVNAVSGYAGGSQMTATYEQVSTGTTGHAESVQIKYDPKKVSYGKILQIFFSVVHDPTELNRQGPDSGTQYRSAIFTTTDEQKKVAEAYIAQLNAAKVYRKPIVTKVSALQGFFPAEAYHQDYLTLHPNQPYIAYNDLPKVENLKKVFADNYIEKPTLVSSVKAIN